MLLLLLLGSESSAGAELKKGISEVEGVIEGSLGILDFRGKIFSK